MSALAIGVSTALFAWLVAGQSWKYALAAGVVAAVAFAAVRALRES